MGRVAIFSRGLVHFVDSSGHWIGWDVAAVRVRTGPGWPAGLRIVCGVLAPPAEEFPRRAGSGQAGQHEQVVAEPGEEELAGDGGQAAQGGPAQAHAVLSARARMRSSRPRGGGGPAAGAAWGAAATGAPLPAAACSRVAGRAPPGSWVTSPPSISRSSAAASWQL